MPHVMMKYYILVYTRKKIQVDAMNNQKTPTLQLDYSDNKYEYVNSIIENRFEKSIYECYSDLSTVTEPILSLTNLIELVDLYKNKLPKHYECMIILFGFNKNQNSVLSGCGLQPF